MPITPVDGIVIVVILVSAFLAMVRGLSRELLALVTWCAAGISAYYFYPYLVPFFQSYLSDDKIAVGVSLVVVFLVTFLVLYPISIKISDFIIDSKAGVLDRTLGFLFGIVRGVFILALAALIINFLVKPENRHSWLNDSKTKPFLDSVGNDIINAIPVSFYDQVNSFLNEKPSDGTKPMGNDRGAVSPSSTPLNTPQQEPAPTSPPSTQQPLTQPSNLAPNTPPINR